MTRRRQIPAPGVFGPRTLADGSEVWDVRYRDHSGRNRSKTARSLGEANAFSERTREAKRNDEDLPTRSRLTLGEYFEVAWPTIRVKRKLGGKTVRLWEHCWNHHICHEEYGIAGRELRQLTRNTRLLDQFVVEMGQAEIGEPIQARVLSVLNAVFRNAVNQGDAVRNPLVEMEGKPSANRAGVLWSPPVRDIEMLREELMNHPNERRRKLYGQRDALIVSMLAYAAPRPEELRDLTWGRSGLADGWIEFRAAKAKRGKSKIAVRRVPLNEVVAEELARWRESLGEPNHSAVLPLPEWGSRSGGGHWDGEDWKDWRERVFRPALRRVADREGGDERMAELRPYDLRHAAVSLWLANGGRDEKGNLDGSPANPVDVAEWAGHGVETMWRTYAHTVKGTKRIRIAEQIRQARAELGE